MLSRADSRFCSFRRVAKRRLFPWRNHCICLVRKTTKVTVTGLNRDRYVAVVRVIFDVIIFVDRVRDRFEGHALTIHTWRLRFCSCICLDTTALGSVQTIVNVLPVRSARSAGFPRQGHFVLASRSRRSIIVSRVPGRTARRVRFVRAVAGGLIQEGHATPRVSGTPNSGSTSPIAAPYKERSTAPGGELSELVDLDLDLEGP